MGEVVVDPQHAAVELPVAGDCFGGLHQVEGRPCDVALPITRRISDQVAVSGLQTLGSDLISGKLWMADHKLKVAHVVPRRDALDSLDGGPALDCVVFPRP